MIRSLFDANVLASGIVGARIPASTTGELLRRWRNRDFILVISDHVLEETQRTLAKSYFRQRLTERQAASAIRLLQRKGEHAAVTEVVAGIASHAEDDLVLAAAVSARVPYLVTGDAGLLAVGRYRGVTITSARFFRSLLDRHSDQV